MEFEFKYGRGGFVLVNATRKIDMHGNVMLHISANDSLDGRERWIGEHNPCIRLPGQSEPKLGIQSPHIKDRRYPPTMRGRLDNEFVRQILEHADLQPGDRRFRNIR